MIKQCSNCKWVKAHKHNPERSFVRATGGIMSSCTLTPHETTIPAISCCSRWEYFETQEIVFGPGTEMEYKKYSDVYKGLTGVIR